VYEAAVAMVDDTAWTEETKGLDPIRLEDLLQYTQAFDMLSRGRCFCTILGGFTGCVPEEAKTGDTVLGSVVFQAVESRFCSILLWETIR
jgi:hypothetical protein